MQFWARFTYCLGFHSDDKVFGQLQSHQTAQASELHRVYQPAERMLQWPVPVMHARMQVQPHQTSEHHRGYQPVESTSQQPAPVKKKSTITDSETVKAIVYNSPNLTGSDIQVQGRRGLRWIVYDDLDENGKLAIDKYRNRRRNGI